MKKRYLLLLFLLLVPFTDIKAISWGIIKDLDTSWKSSDGYSYGCYFLHNGEGQDGHYTYTPTYTGRAHSTGNTTGSQGAAEDLKHDARCLSGKMYSSDPDADHSGANYVGLYPFTGATSCKLLPEQFLGESKSDDRYGCSNGGCTNISYDNWTKSGGNVSIAECIAATIIINSDAQTDDVEENIMIEAKKNSDFLSSSDINLLQGYYSDFNDDTEFCFVRGHHGDEYATYFGHAYADLTFSDEFLHSSSNKDSQNREIVTIPSSMPSDDSFNISIYPNVNNAMEILKLKELDGQMMDTDSLVVLNKGKLVTDPTLCSKEVIDAFIQDDEEAMEEIDPEILNQILDGDFEYWLDKGYKKSKAIDICTDTTVPSGDEKCYRYTFPPTIGHPMYNTTVWTNRKLACGFVETTWTYDQCKDGSIAGMYQEKINVSKVKKDTIITTTYDRKITKSGYNGVADFFEKVDKSDGVYKCKNFKVVHLIYRAFIIFAPIMTILFVSFDLVSSLVSGDAQKVKKFRDKLVRRIIALILLIIIPIFINILVNTLSKNNHIKDSSILKCVVIGE